MEFEGGAVVEFEEGREEGRLETVGDGVGHEPSVTLSLPLCLFRSVRVGIRVGDELICLMGRVGGGRGGGGGGRV